MAPVCTDAPAEGFVVLFKDGHGEPFACILDAHKRMNERQSGALCTVRASDGARTATPMPFDYLDLWRWGK